MLHKLDLTGIVHLMQYRNGMLHRDLTVQNKIVWQAKADLLNQFFKGATPWANFYVGLLKGDWDQFTENAPSLATLASKQFTTYDEAVRQHLVFDDADTTTDTSYIFIRNSSSNFCVFTVSTGVVNQALDGIFIAPGNVKTDTPTRIWCSAAFGNNDATPAPVTVNAGDVLRIQYTVRIPKA